ncbi:Lrp/AsnC family transcriptional regulator [Vulcanisaeta sp. JCM 16159]|uniref:Lrp/AsnC family transcriptional regulator n=1 Tax=Vulcanisaeta sp. JCM 16159 TaxID=1295371 RepID=UPI0006CF8DA5|nr:Lrp/AsnC family transcriptional regulator [Vulcanisaeta sp. JCM 16159]
MRRVHGNDSLLLDDLDHEILRVLEEDCALTYHEVAKRVGRSPWTVRHRIERLKRMGVIKGCRAVVDYKALGYSEVVLFFNVPPENMEEALDFMRSQEMIKELFIITGDKRIVTVIVGRDLDNIRRFILNNLTKFKVYNTELNVVIDKVK